MKFARSRLKPLPTSVPLASNRVVMLTGDRRRTAELVARSSAGDETFLKLSPAKIEYVSVQRGGKAVCNVR